MRVLTILVCILFALPVLAQDRACRGKKSFDLGDGAKGCIVAIEEGSITTTVTRDDGQGGSVRKRAQPLVAALMSGANTTQRNKIKQRMVAICKVALVDVQKQFAGQRYNRIILLMDWRRAGGEIQSGFSSKDCRGFQFFRG